MLPNTLHTDQDIKDFAMYYIKQVYEIRYRNGQLKTFQLDSLNWTVKIINTKKRIGCASLSKKLSFSRLFFTHENFVKNFQFLKDVILHEIAHAIDIEIRGDTNHDKVWKAIASQIGATPKATNNKLISPKAKYTLSCPTCGNTESLHRNTSSLFMCGICYPKYKKSIGGRPRTKDQWNHAMYNFKLEKRKNF